jgi:DHA2 family multidrug resistance protein
LKSWIAFLALCLGMFMAILDIQIVATALPEIQSAIHIATDQMSWIQTSYLIAEVIAIPLTGWLTRVMSTRWLFVSAILGFTAASLACALSSGFAGLIVGRILQGFCGGVIIPTVFAAGFQLFPERMQIKATVVAGAFAMLAPTLGPLIGGWLTETYSWRWLFLINIAPGLLAAAVAAKLFDVDRPTWSLIRNLDLPALISLAVSLASFELLLKHAPKLGWLSGTSLGLGALFVIGGWLCVRRCLRAEEKLIDFLAFRDLGFAVCSWYSFVLGMGLYGAVYLMPLFLAYVRQHSPLEIGMIVLVTGAAQLAAAPMAAWADARMDARLLTIVGYALFAVGLYLGAELTFESDYDAHFWPQILRGAAIPLCLLPTTRLALADLPADRLAMASGLFNLMRNLGGAIGLALIDTMLAVRPEGHATDIAARLQSGDRATAAFVGLPLERFAGQPLGPVDAATVEIVRPLVERAAAVSAFNDCWLMLAALVAASLLAAPFLRKGPAKGVDLG